jgi:hypothetical protein
VEIRNSSFLLLLLITLIFSCAKTGRPDGGPKDELAPLFVTSEPPYETINFSSKEVTLDFNEFIKLKDINKQLVVSPPLKNPLLISPQGTASKTLNIEILDTLTINTTYIFNFGNAIEDNNESNILEGFKAGQLITIGAGTGGGKSAFAVNITLNVADQGYKVGLWSFEMDKQEVYQRIISVQTSISKKDYSRKEERYNAARKYLKETKHDIQVFTDRIKDLGSFYGSSAFLMGKFMQSSRNPLNPSKVFEKETHF